MGGAADSAWPVPWACQPGFTQNSLCCQNAHLLTHQLALPSPPLPIPAAPPAAPQASQAPANELPNALMNALASFVASVSEPALVQVLLPLVNAVVNEASGAGAGQGPPGKGKAGLFIMLAVLLRTRPQVRGTRRRKRG